MAYLIQKIEKEEDLSIAYSIRYRVFVDEQGVDPLLERDGLDKNSLHFLSWEGEIPGGTARIRFTPKGIKIERFAVLSLFRGKGMGKALAKFILEYIDEELKNYLGEAKNPSQDLPQYGPVNNLFNPMVYLNAQIQVIPFYLKFGFREEGEPFEEAGIGHKKMVRDRG